MTRARLAGFVLALAALLLAPAAGAAGQSKDAPPAAAVPPVTTPSTGVPDSVEEVDRNGDSVVDYRVVYDHAGMVSRVEMDYDLDGKMDTFFFYDKGVLQREEIDSNGDGKVDIWVYLVDGKYVQRWERDTNGDGTPDVVRDFGGG